MLTTSQMEEILKDCGRGSLLFVSYKAGKPPTDRALLESERAVHVEGMSKRHFVGTFESLWVTRKGATVLTIMAFNRDKMTGDGLVEGGYRTFNPELGELLTLEVIEPRPKDRVQTLYEAAMSLPEGELKDLSYRLSELVQIKKEQP